MTKEILCTLGPASLDRRIITRLEQSGATLFRINLSHTKVAELRQIIQAIRQATDVPICLDTEGAQIRTSDFVDGSVTVRENTIVRAYFRRVPGDGNSLSFYPPGVGAQLKVGDLITIDFNSVLAQVIAYQSESVSMRVLQGGQVGSNKAVTVERHIQLPALTEKDKAALRLGRNCQIHHFALSFASHGADVDELRRTVGEGAFVISKIESRSGLENLEEIGARSDALLLDRGDLSREMPIEFLPRIQKSVVRRAKRIGCKVYVATNVLESMVSMPTPTRAEVNDIYNTLADGADGLVLAAETAIGQYPIQCTSMIRKMIRVSECHEKTNGDYYPVDGVSLLVEPHGGPLIHREAGPGDLEGIGKLPSLAISERHLIDCERLGYGVYSPLAGFMDRETLESVLDTHRLRNGKVWTLPILLQVNSGDVKAIGTCERVALTNGRGDVHALIDVSEIYDYDLESLANRIYGTTTRAHPGVTKLMDGGSCFIGGDVTFVAQLKSPHQCDLFTPEQLRFIFAQLGWSQVIGFLGRNPAARAHESIHLQALERTGADGLYINPVMGQESGAFLPEPILLSYQTLLEFGCYPKGKVVLGSSFTYSRYAGPREAVFTALCHKNMGCSHFIVGGDNMGVDSLYPAHAAQELFDTVGDLGIQPVFFDTIGYNIRTGQYEANRGEPLRKISATAVRERLRAHKQLPDWIMRDMVVEVLLAEIKSGRPVFYE